MLKKKTKIVPSSVTEPWKDYWVFCCECGKNMNRKCDTDVCAECDEGLYGHLKLGSYKYRYSCRNCGKDTPDPVYCHSCRGSEKHKNVSDENLFELVGTDRKLDKGMTWGQFFERVRDWEPDQLAYRKRGNARGKRSA